MRTSCVLMARQRVLGMGLRDGLGRSGIWCSREVQRLMGRNLSRAIWKGGNAVGTGCGERSGRSLSNDMYA